MNSIPVGAKVKFTTSHSDGSLITFSARVAKLDGKGNAWVEMPLRIRRLPFPPLGGKRYGLYPMSSLVLAPNQSFCPVCNGLAGTCIHDY